MDYLNTLIFGIYPYIALAIFFIGTWARYDTSQFTWRAGSSQMLGKNRMRLASNLFHIGILVIFFGHLVGLLTPHWVYSPFISAGAKQILAIVVGGLAGIACLLGAGMLAWRRLTNPRVRQSGSFADAAIIVILFVQVLLGLMTIPPTIAGHLDGSTMLLLASWAQAIFTFQGDAAQYVAGVGWIYKIHMFLGLTIFLIFPFTRLVHMFSVPLEYLGRRYQVVRRRV